MGFLIRGWTTACLNIPGATQYDRPLFKRARINGPTVKKTSLNNQGGRESFGEPIDFQQLTSSCRDDRVTGSKLSKIAELGTETEEVMSMWWDLSPGGSDFLNKKKVQTFSHSAGEDSIATPFFFSWYLSQFFGVIWNICSCVSMGNVFKTFPSTSIKEVIAIVAYPLHNKLVY